MSYEGYYQVLCSNGHLSCEDCYTFYEDSWTCGICGSKVDFVYSVDQTNCGGHEFPFKIKKQNTCKSCGHSTEITYYKPTDAEIKEFERRIICGYCGMGLHDGENGFDKLRKGGEDE